MIPDFLARGRKREEEGGVANYEVSTKKTHKKEQFKGVYPPPITTCGLVNSFM